MLVLARRTGETIEISDDIQVAVLAVNGGEARPDVPARPSVVVCDGASAGGTPLSPRDMAKRDMANPTLPCYAHRHIGRLSHDRHRQPDV
jgi:hypothetical protein